MPERVTRRRLTHSPLTVFSSSDPSIADVTPNGLVEFKRAGEIAVLGTAEPATAARAVAGP